MSQLLNECNEIKLHYNFDFYNFLVDSVYLIAIHIIWSSASGVEGLFH